MPDITVIKCQGKTEKEKKKDRCQTLSKHDFAVTAEISPDISRDLG